jgi:hypothetical protein
MTEHVLVTTTTMMMMMMMMKGLVIPLNITKA